MFACIRLDKTLRSSHTTKLALRPCRSHQPVPRSVAPAWLRSQAVGDKRSRPVTRRGPACGSFMRRSSSASRASRIASRCRAARIRETASDKVRGPFPVREGSTADLPAMDAGEVSFRESFRKRSCRLHHLPWPIHHYLTSQFVWLKSFIHRINTNADAYQ